MTSFELTYRAKAVVTHSIKAARKAGNDSVHPLHVALILMDVGGGANGVLGTVVETVGGNRDEICKVLRREIARLPAQDPSSPIEGDDSLAFHHSTMAAFREARELQLAAKESFVALDHIILGLLMDSSIIRVFKDRGLDIDALKTSAKQLRETNKAPDAPVLGGFNKYLDDLINPSKEVASNLDAVLVGRQEEMKDIIRILSRRAKNNVLLVGAAGVGKSCLVVRGLGERLAKGGIPTSLGSKPRFYGLNVRALRSGRDNLDSVLTALETSFTEDDVTLLFIDDIHLLMSRSKKGEGQSNLNSLDSALARGKVRCIAATTPENYQKYIEKDPVMSKNFNQVEVKEPSPVETVEILRSIRKKQERHHQVKIPDPLIEFITALAQQYLTSRRLPDSAIDLMDEACASSRAERDHASEEIVRMETRRTELEAEIRTLRREISVESSEKLVAARNEITDINKKLAPLKNAYEKERRNLEEIDRVNKQLEEFKLQACEAERHQNASVVADLRYYAIPDLQDRLKRLEEMAIASHELSIEVVAEIVAKKSGVSMEEILPQEEAEVEEIIMLKEERKLGRIRSWLFRRTAGSN